MDVHPSPKQPHKERLKDWYPYYAGYTAAFAASVFETHLTHAQSVVDPWNGSGTTTSVAVRRGIGCLGIDLNPALTVVARARLTPRSIEDSLVPIGLEILDAAGRLDPKEREVEPLTTWLQPGAVRDIRKIQRAIHLATSPDESLEAELAIGSQHALSSLPLITAFFYAALFASCRDLLRSFRGTNPTWLVSPQSPRHRLRPSAATIHRAFLDRIDYLRSRLVVEGSDSTELASLLTGPAEGLLLGRGPFDACLTSPPYATRIDYIKGSLPELALLGLSSESIGALRRNSTRTPVVRNASYASQNLPAAAVELIERIASHGSHGSANYYAPWLRNYLVQLDQTLKVLSESVKPTGRVALVVQDSYYKTIQINLQHLVRQSLASAGRRLVHQQDFEVRHSMSFMNPRARRHLPHRANRESLLVFE